MSIKAQKNGDIVTISDLFTSINGEPHRITKVLAGVNNEVRTIYEKIIIKDKYYIYISNDRQSIIKTKDFEEFETLYTISTGYFTTIISIGKSVYAFSSPTTTGTNQNFTNHKVYKTANLITWESHNFTSNISLTIEDAYFGVVFHNGTFYTFAKQVVSSKAYVAVCKSTDGYSWTGYQLSAFTLTSPTLWHILSFGILTNEMTTILFCELYAAASSKNYFKQYRIQDDNLSQATIVESGYDTAYYYNSDANELMFTSDPARYYTNFTIYSLDGSGNITSNNGRIMMAGPFIEYINGYLIKLRTGLTTTPNYVEMYNGTTLVQQFSAVNIYPYSSTIRSKNDNCLLIFKTDGTFYELDTINETLDFIGTISNVVYLPFNSIGSWRNVGTIVEL